MNKFRILRLSRWTQRRRCEEGERSDNRIAWLEVPHAEEARQPLEARPGKEQILPRSPQKSTQFW